MVSKKIQDAIEVYKNDIVELENRIKNIEDTMKTDGYKEYKKKVDSMKIMTDAKLKAKKAEMLKKEDEIYADCSDDAIAELKKDIESYKAEIKTNAAKCVSEMKKEIKKSEQTLDEIKDMLEEAKKLLKSKEEEIKKETDEGKKVILEADISGAKSYITTFEQTIKSKNAELIKAKKDLTDFCKKHDILPEKEKKRNDRTAIEEQKYEEKKYNAVQQLIVKAKKYNSKRAELTAEDAIFLTKLLSDENNYAKYGIRTKGYLNFPGIKKFGNESIVLTEALKKYIGNDEIKAKTLMGSIENKYVKDTIESKGTPWDKGMEMDTLRTKKGMRDYINSDEIELCSKMQVVAYVEALKNNEAVLSDNDKAILKKLEGTAFIMDGFKNVARIKAIINEKNITKKQALLNKAKETKQDVVERKDKFTSFIIGLKDDTYPPIEAEEKAKKVESKPKKSIDGAVK